MASYANWKPYTSYVQSGGEGPGMVDGRYLSGAFVGIFAGPSRLAQIGGVLNLQTALENPAEASQIVYPIGIVQNFNLSQNKQITRIFELGSQRSYFIPGRTVGQVGLSRIMYDGPSMLRVLYAYYQDLLPETIVPAMFPNIGASAIPNPHNVIVPPGYENLYVNLASDLFDQPIGLLITIKNNNQDTYGAFYLECCQVPNTSLAVDSGGVLMQESAAIQYEQVVPIATRSIELIT